MRMGQACQGHPQITQTLQKPSVKSVDGFVADTFCGNIRGTRAHLVLSLCK